ncbi:MAG: 3-isopropylmalate dehydratase small subunit [bacterium]|nr:3-isopropylmalate dehydratase small subunit [Gammaproteobacteria bacterium]HIL95041.1 3-isopropylmalate dehydratase small subunit [Pseudomonadales bacterium]
MKISKINGKGVYVPGNDIDTDRIIPARFLKCVTFDELGPSLFYDVRFDAEGNSKNHVLDQPQHKGAKVLISDVNFGCGSSREHAPQALQKFGISAVIAESFAEIFHGNCTTLGIPCVVMRQEDRQKLVESIELDAEADLIIDLESLKVICANNSYDISMKDSAREALLAATYDPLDTLLSEKERIDATARRLGYL